MEVITENWERTMRMEVWTRGMERTLIKLLAPPQGQGNQDPQTRYADVELFPQDQQGAQGSAFNDDGFMDGKRLHQR